MIIRETSEIAHPKELEGRQIGIAPGAAVYLALKNMANDCNVDLNAVQFVHLLPHDQLIAFEAGKIDALACWEPWTTKARMVGGKFYFSGNQSEIPGMEGQINWLINQSSVIVPEAHLAREPELVMAILRVLRKATDLLTNHRKEVSKELASAFGLSRVELMMAMQKNTYDMTIDNLFRIGVLGFRDFLYENGRVSARLPEQALYDATFLRQVDPASVRLGEAAAEKVAILEQDGIYYRENAQFQAERAPLQFLLADDSRFMRVTLARIVKQLGGQVIGEATTGSEAIELFARLRPNVITMDLSMPGVSGVDAIKSILQTDPQANIIVVSGANQQELREQVFALGVKMFITKPFEPEKVTAVLTEQIRRA